MQRTRIFWLAFVVLGLALVATSLCAQTTGTIYGQVSDPSGAAVPEANITAQNTATGLERKAVSTPVGSYLVPSLPPGPYKLTVERTGFKTYSQSGITVIVGENARVDAALEIGAVTQTVEVSASAVAVDTQSTTVGTTVDNLRVQAMPLNGRNVLALSQLLPGVGTADFPTVNLGDIRIPVSGSRNTQNNLMLDGTPMVSQINNGITNLPSPDALQEFRVLTNTFSAQYGRASGGVFLAVTKSGTNEFHGSLYEYLRNDALNARNFFAGAEKPKLRQNQFGGSIGGPVRLPGYNGRDRTFFFFNYQGTRIRQQYLNVFYPPTPEERQGIFASSITDPNTGQPFPNNTIPPDRFDPLAKGMLDAYVVHLPNMPDGRNVTLVPQPTDGNDYTAKVDHQLSESNRLSFRFYRNDATQSNREFGTAIGGGLALTATNLVQTEDFKWTTTFSPRLLNEATFSFFRFATSYKTGPGNKSPRELGGNFNYDGANPLAPWANVAGRFAVSSGLAFEGVLDTFYFGDKVTWMHGRHSITAGAEIIPMAQTKYVIDFWNSGFFLFAGAFTGNAFADYLIGRPVFLGAQSQINNAARSENYHFFVQDDFKINSRLTLNLGLRYEANTPWWEKDGKSGIVLPGQQSQRFPTAPPGLVYPGDIPRGLIPTDKNNFQPRIGFAWDPTGKGRTAIRAAFAVFTHYTGSIMSHSPNQAQPFLLSLGIAAPASFSDPWDAAGGGIDPFPYVVNTENPTFIYPMQGFSITPDFRDGYIEQWNFNIQHQFGPSVLVKAGYYGNVGHKLSDEREANQPVFGPGATAANVQERRPYFPQYYGSIAQSTSDANSHYHSLQVGVEKKFSRGYTLQLAYTFSKSIDNKSLSNTDVMSCQDGNNCRRGERGLSTFDQRHILAINGVWELPFMKGNRFLGGWQLAGLTRYGSGTPFSVFSGVDRALIGAGQDTGLQRADLVGNWRLDPNRPHGELVTKYFDTSAFALPELGKFGNSGRNIIIGPGFSQTDLSLQKKFKLPGERGAFEFRADFFNLFNQFNIGSAGAFGNTFGGGGLDTTIISPGFGRIQYARDARIVQLALRFDF